MLLPDCFAEHNLISTGCPFESYFGQSYVYFGLVYCEDPQLYYCNNTDDGRFAYLLRFKLIVVLYATFISLCIPSCKHFFQYFLEFEFCKKTRLIESMLLTRKLKCYFR